MNNIRKKTANLFYIFDTVFAITGIETDLPTEFLSNPKGMLE